MLSVDEFIQTLARRNAYPNFMKIHRFGKKPLKTCFGDQDRSSIHGSVWVTVIWVVAGFYKEIRKREKKQQSFWPKNLKQIKIGSIFEWPPDDAVKICYIFSQGWVWWRVSGVGATTAARRPLSLSHGESAYHRSCQINLINDHNILTQRLPSPRTSWLCKHLPETLAKRSLSFSWDWLQ